jgi:hypothetical protein
MKRFSKVTHAWFPAGIVMVALSIAGATSGTGCFDKYSWDTIYPPNSPDGGYCSRGCGVFGICTGGTKYLNCVNKERTVACIKGKVTYDENGVRRCEGSYGTEYVTVTDGEGSGDCPQ